MIGAILLAIFVTLWAMVINLTFMQQGLFTEVEDEKNGTRKKFNSGAFGDPEDWTRAVILGVLIGATRFVVTKFGELWFLQAVALAVTIGMMIYLAWWFAKGGATWKAFFCWSLLMAICTMLAGRASENLVRWSTISRFLVLIVALASLPYIVGTLCEGSALVGLLRYKDHPNWALFVIWIVVLDILITLLLVAFSGRIVNLANRIQEQEMQGAVVTEVTPEPTLQPVATAAPMPTVQPAPMPTAQPNYGVWNGNGGQYNGNQYGGNQYGYNGQLIEWWTFYNLTIQNDGLASNDNDFGPNPYRGDWWVTEYVNEMLTRIRKDPVLGAADIAYFDHIAGTNISGVKYDKDPQKWLDNINARAVEFVKNQAMYNGVVDEFIRTLNSNILQNVEIKLRKDVKNLMYMEPNNTVNLNSYGNYGYGNYGYNNSYNYGSSYNIKMPKVIMKAHNEEAYFLIFTVKNGNSTGEALYKLACGYQPPIEAKAGTGGGGINPGGNDNPGSGPSSPDTPYHKDPTKGTDVGINDTKGPGTDTNNGVGSWISAADTDTNSITMDYSEYRQEMQHIATTNDNQKVGGDPNTPTVSAPSGTEVISNADNGTGNGGIDTATPVESYVRTDGGVAVGTQTETHIEMPD